MGAAGGAAPPPPGGAAPATTTAGGEQTPDAGGKVITVKMITDGTSNRFEPANFEAHQGDVIRYVLETGVHNVHFLPDSNPGKQGLPTTPSDYLQLPGQTYDVKVTWAEGKYYYQCDPHAVLGMVGYVEVEKKD
jgi:plastocyanin